MNNEELEPKKEKRVHERSDCKGIIKWSYFNQGNCFDGELVNFSQKGFYFETSEPVKTGATIFIQFTEYFPENLSPNDSDGCRNEIQLNSVIDFGSMSPLLTVPKF